MVLPTVFPGMGDTVFCYFGEDIKNTRKSFAFALTGTWKTIKIEYTRRERGVCMKKLLVVVDFQNDFVNGTLGFPEAKQLEEPICQKIEQYRKEDADILFTFDTHDASYLQTKEGQALPVEHCIKGTAGWNLYGRVAAYCSDGAKRIEKPSFGSMELMQVAKSGMYDLVELCGLVSNICVLSNAVLVKTALPQADVVVDARCTGSSDPILHEKALDVLAGLQIGVLGR